MNMINEIKVKYIPTKISSQPISSAVEAIRLFKLLWDQDTLEYVETFNVILLNRAKIPIGFFNTSKGGITSVVVDIRVIMATALKCAATSIVIAHNHPSGNLKPSQADIELTNKMKSAGELLDIKVLDHIILTKESGVAFSSLNLI